MRFAKTAFNDDYFLSIVSFYLGKSIEEINDVEYSFLLKYSNKTDSEFKRIFYSLKEEDTNFILYKFGVNNKVL